MSLLVTLLVILLVCAILYWIVSLLPLPQPFKQIAMVIVAVIMLIWVLDTFGVLGGSAHGHIHYGRW